VRKHLVYPFLDGCGFAQTVDLACGHGRNTPKLLPLANALIEPDVQPGNIEVCRQRFAASPTARFECNNGYDFWPVPDRWATLVYCFDSRCTSSPTSCARTWPTCNACWRRAAPPFATTPITPAAATGAPTPARAITYPPRSLPATRRTSDWSSCGRSRSTWGEEIDLDCLSLVRQPVSSVR
jgi:hypothetical protein